ncbi:AAA-like domain protein [Caulifigura coniformis]|uniref:AAA-like domain protein n=1 Tax=Caulifigura coniformis TaxID=2527983 RepID=A0A517SES4_9PLAN|nr:DUF87 domain-containing protein [Caulifigura coniformis]QDT54619.1 AAA-like domain protein [Caulifigura coniformis]
MKQLAIAKNLSVPLDAISRPWAFLGIRGSGKTYAAGKLVETMLDAKAQVVILDPIGNWYGLRLDRTGKKPSRFAIPIIGGLHGDVPIEPQAGGLVADFVVDTGSSVVLDVSQLRKEQRKHFATDFAEQLFHRKKAHRSPLHLAIEESQVFIPQMGKGQERMLGAFEDLVRLGRNFGIGVSMITQRPQSVNKEVLNQAEPLVVFQLVGKHERDAVKGWMQHVGADLDDAMAKLAGLQEGDCYFWSPAWLRTFQPTRFLEKNSFDGSSTPGIGEATASRKLAAVDLGALQKSMATVIEKKKADDPAELRKTIAQLQKQLAVKVPAGAMKSDQAAIDRAVKKAVHESDKWWSAEAGKLLNKINRIKGVLGDGGLDAIPVRPALQLATEPAMVPAPPELLAAVERRHSAPRSTGDDGLTGPEQRILDALAWLESIGVKQPANSTVAFIADYSPTTSSYKNAKGALRTKGLIEYLPGGCLSLTDDGVAAAVHPTEIHTDNQLRERILSRLPGPEQKILTVLIEAYPVSVSYAALADATAYSSTTSSFKNARGALRSLGFATYPAAGEVRAADLLFPGRAP